MIYSFILLSYCRNSLYLLKDSFFKFERATLIYKILKVKRKIKFYYKINDKIHLSLK